MAQIFVSYSRDDLEFTKRLVPLLNRAYEGVWFDKDLRGGQQWKSEIMRRIGTCDIFLYLVSADSLESPYCKQEYDEARRLNKPVLPVLIEQGVMIPTDISKIQYVDMSDSIARKKQMGAPSQLNINITSDSINELHAAIRQILDTRKTNPRAWLAAIGVVVLVAALLGTFLIYQGLPLKGGEIAYTTNQDGPTRIYNLNGGLAGYFSGLFGNNPHNVTPAAIASGQTPAWSPDGKTIAFVSGNQIMIFEVGSGTPPRPLTNGIHPAWSPNKTNPVIAYAKKPNGQQDYEIFTILANEGTAETQITDNDYDDLWPSWSPDATQIAFQSKIPLEDSAGLGDTGDPAFKPPTQSDIFIVNAAPGQTPRNLTESVKVNEEYPAWSPNQVWVAFQSNSECQAPATVGSALSFTEICVMDVTDGSIFNVTHNQASDSYPAWSSDGDEIAFISTRSNTDEIYVSETICINKGCGEPRRLTFIQGASLSYLAWRPAS